MCVGVLPADRLTSAGAAGEGNLLVLYGARTGRDGIGGASVLASQGFDEGSSAKRPSVQIGDPFMGKKLIECTLELLDRGLLASLQDLGAAGLASSTSEMAAHGGVGLDIDLSRVPLREQGMEPFEIMISESQERMAAIVEPSQLDAVLETCARWQVDATPIGTVTGSGSLRAFHDGELVGDIPVRDAGRRRAALRGGAATPGPPPRAPAGRRSPSSRRPRPCLPSCAPPTSAAAAGSTASTTSSSAPERPFAREATLESSG